MKPSGSVDFIIAILTILLVCCSTDFAEICLYNECCIKNDSYCTFSLKARCDLAVDCVNVDEFDRSLQNDHDKQLLILL